MIIAMEKIRQGELSLVILCQESLHSNKHHSKDDWKQVEIAALKAVTKLLEFHTLRKRDSPCLS